MDTNKWMNFWCGMEFIELGHFFIRTYKKNGLNYRIMETLINQFRFNGNSPAARIPRNCGNKIVNEPTHQWLCYFSKIIVSRDWILRDLMNDQCLSLLFVRSNFSSFDSTKGDREKERKKLLPPPPSSCPSEDEEEEEKKGRRGICVISNSDDDSSTYSLLNEFVMKENKSILPSKSKKTQNFKHPNEKN